jgi:hypothetical protein
MKPRRNKANQSRNLEKVASSNNTMKKSDKEPYPQPKQSHKENDRLWAKYLQQRAEQNRADSPGSAQNKRSSLPKTKRQCDATLPKRPLSSIDHMTNALVATLRKRWSYNA